MERIHSRRHSLVATTAANRQQQQLLQQAPSIAMLPTLLVAVFAVLGCVQGHPASPYDPVAETRSFSSDLKEDGSYNYQFDTTNGIAAQETGVGGYYASGSSAYYSPEGQLIQLQYTADENGFHPTGDHLPTPPPIPKAILQALEYIRTHPNQEERQGPTKKPQPLIQQRQYFHQHQRQ